MSEAYLCKLLGALYAYSVKTEPKASGKVSKYLPHLKDSKNLHIQMFLTKDIHDFVDACVWLQKTQTSFLIRVSLCLSHSLCLSLTLSVY